jgi:acetaldehyde dehydrogenase (acetylating)
MAADGVTDQGEEINKLVERVVSAQKKYEEFSQQQVDCIIEAMAKEAERNAETLARMAVEETGFGRIQDKIIKNYLASRNIYEYIKEMKTVGVVNSYPDLGIEEIASPVGVVLAIIPSTNPTSTTIFKALISLKSRNGVVFSPHPTAANCIKYTAGLLHKAAVSAGAPEGIIACIDNSTIEATNALMKHPGVAVILATGGMGMVRAAYSSGKPAYGVGPGNVPAYIDRSADADKAVQRVLTGKTFDWGTVCSSEQAIVADAPVYEKVTDALKKYKAHLCSPEETGRLEKTVVTPQFGVNPDIVGRSPVVIADKAGFKVPEDTTALVVEYSGVGKDFPLSIEKLSPVLALYKVNGWREGCARCIEILSFGGLGHTLSLHCEDEKIIREFALRKPASRILLNTSSTHGAVGFTTNLPPSLTLGCGPLGDNITSDNITPLHLVTIKRLARGVREAESTLPVLQSGRDRPGDAGMHQASVETQEDFKKSSTKKNITEIVDGFLEGRISKGKKMEISVVSSSTLPEVAASTESETSEPLQEELPADFVCETDVVKAINSGSKIRITKKTIITPLARELADKYQILIVI